MFCVNILFYALIFIYLHTDKMEKLSSGCLKIVRKTLILILSHVS
jgi:hypothetical protein